jgi:hypothetical protein
MSRRRHRRNRNPLHMGEDTVAIALGVLGGGAALYLYLKPYISATPIAKVTSLAQLTQAPATTTASTTG